MKGTLGRIDKPIRCYYNNCGCLIVTSHTLGNDGYPQIQRDRKRWRLSRWVFYNNYRYLPEIVMHICDNPLCVNPAHLIAGTIKLNSCDMIKKGRAPEGKNQFTGGKKLNENQVREIKTKLIKGQSLLSLAKEYHISKKMILYIKQGKKWKYINPLTN